MLCGKCRKQLLCKHCGEPEFSQEVSDDPNFRHDRYECRCKRFREDECQECAKIKEYVGIDAMWYIKSTFEAILIGIMCICFIGFVIGMIFVFIAIPMVWGKPLDYQVFPWVNYVLGWCIPVGLVSILFMASWDSSWRESYEDHSMIFNIEEKRPV